MAKQEINQGLVMGICLKIFLVTGLIQPEAGSRFGNLFW